MSSPAHGLKPPGKLNTSGNLADAWKSYKQVWENYSLISGLNSQTEDYKVAFFLHCVGTEGLKIYNGFQFENENDKKILNKVLEKFDEFTLGQTNETYERYIFNSRNQEAQESIDAYVTALRNLVKSCNFCDCMRDTLIRDRIVLGVSNNTIRKKLLQVRSLTLKQCIDICRSDEATATQLKAISGDDSVHKIRDWRRTGKKDKHPSRDGRNDRNVPPKPPGKSHKKCLFCGGEHPLKKEKCPAWGQKCSGCGGRNHFKSVCKKSKSRGVHGISDQPEDVSSEESDIELLAGVAMDSQESDVHAVRHAKEIYAEMLIDDRKVNLQIDCGASINIIPVKHATGHEIQPTTKTLRMWNGSQVKPIGTTRLIMRNPRTRKKYSVEFVVVESNLTPLIGARAAQQMGLITVHDENFIAASPPPKENELQVKQITAEEVIKQYSDVFDRPLGTFPGEVHLEVDDSVKPVITPTRRVPTALKDDLKEELNRYVAQGILAPVEEPTPWVSSLAVATKKSGALRVCIDPRPLNEALKRETYQIPVLDEILPELSQAKVFSTVDLRSGYWHCVLDQESNLLTTFAKPFRRYRWCRLPFGLSVSSEIFQKRVNQALEGLSGVLNIADDILVYGVGNSEQEAVADHNRNLQTLLKRCRERNIALNRDKLKLKQKEVSFMGHILTSHGVKMDPEKAKAIQEMPKPEDVEGIQRLNGFINYLAKFLPGLADVTEPLRRLTRKDVEWQWTEEQEKSFEEIKRLVTTAPILSYYDPKAELEIQCDASQKGLGAALLQKGKPIAYASRALTDTEERYAQIEKEMLAIVFSLEKFHQYTFG